MTIQRRQILVAAATATASGIAAFPHLARAYPLRPVRIVVPYPAGSSIDVPARILAEALPPLLGQPVIVINTPGGSAAIGTRSVASGESDGHTLLMGTNQTHASNQSLIPNLGYDPVRDFECITAIGRIQHALVVRKDLGVRNLGELVALARKSPGKLTYASSGNASASHLAGEMFKQSAGVHITHIPYRGVAPAVQDLLGGHVDMSFATLPAVLGFVRSGAIECFGIASRDRAPQLPDVRTLAEQGFPHTEADAWTALFAPAKAPADVVQKLRQAVLAVFADPVHVKKLTDAGYGLQIRNGDAYKTFAREDTARWAAVIRSAGIKLD
ncbi:MAG: tripartite tricarboxylate transporter substrate binding protein [Comamonadaceae bacterium]|nr:MAG: tripartite tricarboxylate transporter substrate binding protein [Comamonadaceae bacterium]